MSDSSTRVESALRLSVLDQSPIPAGAGGAAALRNTLDLARLADALGFHRYWVAEHHGTPGLACASPEVLIGPIASATQRIRVGSGGVMLPHYSPLKVAENFSMLSGMFPNRIDLGIGRAAGTDPSTTFALQRDRRHSPPDDFPSQLRELMSYVHGDMADDHPFAHLSRMLPGRPGAPELWLLGSSPQSVIWAAELGLPYAFADFINAGGSEIMKRYARDFAPGARHATPQPAVAVWTICADSEAEARRLATSSEMMMAELYRGRLIEVPPTEEAEAYLARQGEGGLPIMGMRRRTVLGDPQQVRAGIEAVAAEYGAGEVLLVNILHDHAARRRSYELVAEAFEMSR